MTNMKIITNCMCSYIHITLSFYFQAHMWDPWIWALTNVFLKEKWLNLNHPKQISNKISIYSRWIIIRFCFIFLLRTNMFSKTNVKVWAFILLNHLHRKSRFEDGKKCCGDKMHILQSILHFANMIAWSTNVTLLHNVKMQ